MVLFAQARPRWFALHARPLPTARGHFQLLPLAVQASPADGRSSRVARVGQGGGSTAAGAGAAAAAGNNHASSYKGAKIVPLAISVALGLFIRFGLPIPSGVTSQAWSVLALFIGTIAGIVSRPMPAPAVALTALAVGLVTGSMTFAEGVAAFTDEVIWLVLLANFFTKGFAKTGLGDRIALSVVKAIGHTTLGLAYGLNIAEGVIAAGMPSSASRAAGLFYPIVCSISKASGSDPSLGTENKVGAFLIQSSFQATGNSASLWLYGAAQNLLILRLAAQLGFPVASPFTAWFKIMSIPSLVAIALTPLVVYKALPPEEKKTPEAPVEAQRRLAEMGRLSKHEAILGGVVLGMLVLWAASGILHLPAVTTGVMGLAILLLTGTITWDDCASDTGAWTTFVWFAILVSISGMLNKLGLVAWIAKTLSVKIAAAGLSTVPSFGLLLALYTFAHYMFASQVAHVSALYAPFVAMMVQTGTPPMVAIFALAASSNLFGSLTPHASAQAPLFYGSGYVTQGDWYRLGLIFILFNGLVWCSVGAVWWKILGLY